LRPVTGSVAVARRLALSQVKAAVPAASVRWVGLPRSS
jgi:hypothetical protein